MTTLTIAHLYPELLSTYGDRGNVMAMHRRAEWRGIEVNVVPVTRGEEMPASADVVFIGGGSDRIQRVVSEDLATRKAELQRVLARGGVVMGVCGGYQLLGHHYVDPDGHEIHGLGLLDATTVAGGSRIIGPALVNAQLEGETVQLVGFENHGGRTYLGGDARPLGSVVRGGGNNGEDDTEGAVQGGVYGTYLHGPVLPTNPRLCDSILARALEGRGTGGLPALEDSLEDRAHDASTRRG